MNQELIDKKLVSASLQAIADVCSCGADVVQAALQVIRDEVVDTVQKKKKEVSLNFLIGNLVLSPAGQSGNVQFKSLSVTDAIAN